MMAKSGAGRGLMARLAGHMHMLIDGDRAARETARKGEAPPLEVRRLPPAPRQADLSSGQ